MTPRDWIKVVRAKEMARVEKLSYEEGSDEISFMQEAGKKVANQTALWMHQHLREKTVYLLVGKGNNGGDAYVAGAHLIRHGFKVEAFTVFPIEKSSSLSQMMSQKFENAGGKIHLLQSAEDLPIDEHVTYLDGLLGTGFKGEVAGIILEIIEQLQAKKTSVIAIDIPSGIDGNTGDCNPNAIQAKLTITLGLFKSGCFLKNGYEKLGDIVLEDFGLPQKYTDLADPFAYILPEDVFSSLLPKVVKTRHKYQAGLVVAIAGSKGMGGAAKLSGLATLRAGAGIIRLFYPEEMEEEMQNAPSELIRMPWKKPEELVQECNKAKAVFLGPGLGRNEKVDNLLKTILPKIEVPCVLDADALYFFASHLETALPKTVVFTPHKKEMLRLLQKEDLDEEEFLERAQKFAEEKNVCLIVKGAPSWLFYKEEKPVILPYGDPGMATAGTGDVLTGIIAALLAQKMSAFDAAALGVYLHALSGKLASQEKTPYSVIASDLLDFLPKAFKLLQKNDTDHTNQ